MTRRVLVQAHPHRPEAVRAAELVSAELAKHGIDAVAELAEHDLELVIVLGGDGTLLRTAELTRGRHTPLVGINMGHVGFLAEYEAEQLPDVVRRVADRDYVVEERMTLDVSVQHPDGTLHTGWAINEASVEKAQREKMIEVALGIDGRALSTFGCDGVVLATPTGSTAYAFSAGGPIVWPDVEAMCMVPVSAHALFARPLVVGPNSRMSVEILGRSLSSAVVWCDGRRSVEAPPGAHIDVTRGVEPVRLARFKEAPFTSRLVNKFDLPVHGWRGTGRSQ